MNHDNSKISQCLKTTKKSLTTSVFIKTESLESSKKSLAFFRRVCELLKKKESSPKRRGHGEGNVKGLLAKETFCTRYTLLFQLQNLCRREGHENLGVAPPQESLLLLPLPLLLLFSNFCALHLFG